MSQEYKDFVRDQVLHEKLGPSTCTFVQIGQHRVHKGVLKAYLRRAPVAFEKRWGMTQMYFIYNNDVHIFSLDNLALRYSTLFDEENERFMKFLQPKEGWWIWK